MDWVLCNQANLLFMYQSVRLSEGVFVTWEFIGIDIISILKEYQNIPT